MTTNTEEWIARIAGKLTWEILCKVAVKYMAFECQDLENVKLDDAVQSIRRALTTYTYKLPPGESEESAKEVWSVLLIIIADLLSLDKTRILSLWACL